jgi:predicted branched-subunit amino acid permease
MTSSKPTKSGLSKLEVSKGGLIKAGVPKPGLTKPGLTQAAAYWSPDAIVPGIVAIGPILPGTLAFGMAFGALCAERRFSLAEVEVMMAFVYGGLSQFVAVQSWPQHLTASSIATLALLTLTVNIRFALMSASLRSWFGTLPRWQSYPSMLLVTDGGWLAATRYRDHGGANAWFFAGGALVLYLLWLVAAIPGYLLAEQLADPKKYGVDLAMPAFYAAMLVPAWKGLRPAIPWAVAGIVALLAHWLVPGWWFIIVGAISGAITAGLMEPVAAVQERPHD